ncbi:MAG: ribonuclease HII [Candidatus Cloacimonetes bacterium]|nr:ribonuclease HII [Candidatus Cloacimonadota bacterium]MDY0366229.1 ribonuclease HII [Candidatus Syntrophosphaera sp.]
MSALFAYDLALPRTQGRLIGVDEAGRGALAGPVVIAAVALDYSRPIEGINDSKKLSPKRREQLFAQITATAVAFHIVEVDAAWIDAHNILLATLKGMREAVCALAAPSGLCLVDGNQMPSGLPCPARCLIRGDALSACVAAASILAKVHRDRLMAGYDPQYPLYGFAQHKGYGTAAHLLAISDHGPCPLHRKSFAPISQM